MVSADPQGKGYGRRALELLIARLRQIPEARELMTCHVPGDGGPGGFYQRMGFRYTGTRQERELAMVLRFGDAE